ncbi:putative DEAD/DEAH box helicase [Neohortaea acidophila]|uniref:Putative DEAD/DEAH box helicase n=1 Tax=Neohortaea acidophila TaxID=245834 RepID=A0A6A6PMH3_9PEZI|nr:putative DEAD/DEAH box helicase [Neohortaea acidophila]KAF2481016.1 putative DEAD/DEAH box helicase [Neohortaea acidophila]
MADFSFSEDAELLKLNAQVLEEPESYEHWEKLIAAAEAQEGGLHRNSSPGAIASTRDVYDRFLAHFPLFFGYWKKYADMEFAIAGTESAEMVYERGVASIASSVDLWTNYCGFKVETSHDYDVIRELFERGAESVGLDFHAHPFWDKYLEFEERLATHDTEARIFAILGRIINIPMHQYARYGERYRTMAAKRPIEELAPPELIAQYQHEIGADGAPKQPNELEAELRARINSYHAEVFHRTQEQTTQRWTYEQEIKRPYFHVTELDEPQLANWRRYLDFEEAEGDYIRTKFLYERCLVTAANYEEFWLRYARWMLAQGPKQEEVRNIYQRPSFLYVPISQPTIRLAYAQFEESEDRPDIAVAIHEAILMNLPNHVETIVSLANVHRRQHGLEAATEVLKTYIQDENSSVYTRGALVSAWAQLVWKGRGDAEEARQIYVNNQPQYLDSTVFWTEWLDFEIQQPAHGEDGSVHHKRVKSVYDDLRHKSHLPPPLVRDLSAVYFKFLKERGGKGVMKELVQLDREINGPTSVAATLKGNAGVDVTMSGTVENGHAVDNAYAQQAPQAVNGGHP